MCRAVAQMRLNRNAYRTLVGKRSLGRPRHRWVNNIKMDLKEIGSDGTDWIDVPQDKEPVEGSWNMVMNLWVP
jgi:hypothetical protein